MKRIGLLETFPKWQKSLTLRRFLFTCFTAFCLPLILLFSWFSAQRIHSLESQVYMLQQNKLNTIAQELDHQTKQLTSYAGTLQIQSSIKRITKLQANEITVDDQLEMRSLGNTLLNISSTAQDVNCCLLYFSLSEMIVDTLRSLPVSEFEGVLSGISAAPAEDSIWHCLLTKQNNGQWFSGLSLRGETTLYYVKTFPLFNRSGAYCNFIVMMNSSFLKEQLLMDESVGQQYIGIWEGDKCLWESGLRPQETDFSSGSEQWTKDGILYTVSDASVSGCRFVQAVNLGGASTGIASAKLWLILSLILCALVQALITFIIGIQNYKPLAQLLTLAHSDSNPQGDEYALLRKALEESNGNRQKLEDTSRSLKEIDHDDKFYSLLKSENAKAALNMRAAEFCNAAFSENWCLGMIEPFDYTAKEEELPELLCSIKRVLPSSIDDPYVAVPFIQKNAVWLLFNMPSPEKQHVMWFATFMKRALDTIRVDLAADCHVYLSGASNGQSDFSEEFQRMTNEIQVLHSQLDETTSVMIYENRYGDRCCVRRRSRH